MARSPSPLGHQNLRYLRPVQPLRFPANEPEDEKVPESPQHLKLRTFLYMLLEFVLAPCLTLGMFWVVAPAGELASALRLARDIEGRDLVLSETEVAAKRIAELEEELRRRT